LGREHDVVQARFIRASAPPALEGQRTTTVRDIGFGKGRILKLAVGVISLGTTGVICLLNARNLDVMSN
jgi:hypothetical protein